MNKAFKCKRCGSSHNDEGGGVNQWCKICKRKMSMPASLLYKNKGGLFKHDIKWMVNEKNLLKGDTHA